MDLEDRFWDKVVVKDGCWEWTGGKVNGGYGSLAVGPRGAGQIRAHRLSYLFHKGEIPHGRYVLHTCDNPECTNPEHLIVGTPADNMRHVSERKRNPGSRQTHCKRGHEYTPENTILRGKWRSCRTCKNERQRQRHREKRGDQFGVIGKNRKSHCKNGHEYTAENTYVNPRGYRECVTCRSGNIKRFRSK